MAQEIGDATTVETTNVALDSGDWRSGDGGVAGRLRAFAFARLENFCCFYPSLDV
ncbi:hypothetical protein Pint_35264 [Pistacia integerrima]|uniref:Uncharacterized protein n=1 Tax=Pistacia integerrima TaxID=434235 RepID=A0ACC0Y0U8_9ROSI|nr:hypothetical protein Pint_35264 [Pistacia integerrima]